MSAPMYCGVHMCNIRESTEMNCQNIWYGNAPISECVGIFFVGFYNTYRIMYGAAPSQPTITQKNVKYFVR